MFLDIERMTGGTADYIEKSIAISDVIIVICTPRMKERGDNAKTNAALELRAASTRANSNQALLILLIYEGDLFSSVPTLIEPFVSHLLISQIILNTNLTLFLHFSLLSSLIQQLMIFFLLKLNFFQRYKVTIQQSNLNLTLLNHQYFFLYQFLQSQIICIMRETRDY